MTAACEAACMPPDIHVTGCSNKPTPATLTYIHQSRHDPAVRREPGCALCRTWRHPADERRSPVSLEQWLDRQDLALCRVTEQGMAELGQDEYTAIERRLGVRIKPPVDERGPWIHGAPAIRCSDTDSCREAGKWGATGVLPPGHFWYWANAAHTSGYLAHESTGSPKR